MFSFLTRLTMQKRNKRADVWIASFDFFSIPPWKKANSFSELNNLKYRSIDREFPHSFILKYKLCER